MRSLVRTGPVGERGLQRIYGNFEGTRSIDPSIPGIEKLALLQRSPNRSQAKGYRRELLYATATYNDPRFDLVELSRVVGKGENRTDADQIFRDRRTGLYGRIEVKDVTPASQRTNLRKYQRQIDLMAREAARTGQQQAFFNRREIILGLRDYANRRGVFIRRGVVTGRSTAPNTVPYRVAMTDLQQEMVRASRGRAIGGGAGLAFGTWMLIDSSPEAVRAL
ncbi:hypothetical protein [Emcibacter sp. SYSU 3D8]|uniref:hypothetical protein n=1 Tax=Emcibacter sp. SYSU 3D8 TaxID=3133969 RepID=UPI0031FE74D8